MKKYSLRKNTSSGNENPYEIGHFESNKKMRNDPQNALFLCGFHRTVCGCYFFYIFDYFILFFRNFQFNVRRTFRKPRKINNGNPRRPRTNVHFSAYKYDMIDDGRRKIKFSECFRKYPRFDAWEKYIFCIFLCNNSVKVRVVCLRTKRLVVKNSNPIVIIECIFILKIDTITLLKLYSSIIQKFRYSCACKKIIIICLNQINQNNN